LARKELHIDKGPKRSISALASEQDRIVETFESRCEEVLLLDNLRLELLEV